jgi:CDP-glucose 4,6-dehydratase
VAKALKVLVTGASGALGGNLSKHLLSKGHNIVSIKHDEHPFDTPSVLGIQNNITWIRGDITDESLVKRVLADYEIDLVYHLAALPIVRVGTRTCRPLYEVNLMGTLSILEAMKEQTSSGYNAGLIYVATDKVYGEVDYGRKYLETDALNAMAPYETSKACADMTVRMYQKMGYIKSSAVVRPSNIFGPGDFNSRIIPNTIKRCLRGDRPVIFRDITYVREFTYVDDFVRAMSIIGDSVHIGELRGEIFNIGSGDTRTQTQTIESILRNFPQIQPEIKNPEPYMRIEIPYQSLDHTKIFNRFGWKAEIPFDEGIDRTVEWWRTHPELWNETRERNIGK